MFYVFEISSSYTEGNKMYLNPLVYNQNLR